MPQAHLSVKAAISPVAREGRAIVNRRLGTTIIELMYDYVRGGAKVVRAAGVNWNGWVKIHNTIMYIKPNNDSQTP